jgi:hypothetical protein
VVLRYSFDEAGGNVAADSSGFAGGPRNGTLTNVGTGTATFSTNAPLQIGTHYLNLLGPSNVDGGYVVTPSLQTVQGLTPDAATIACWVYLVTDTNWQRLFDFGITPATGNPSIYMYLTTHQAATTPNSVRFTITTTGNSAQQQPIVSSGLLSTNAWHHVAVVLPSGATYTGTLYIDGVSAGTNTAMTLHPANLTGTGTPYGFLGKSAFPTDPYFNGRFDDFRVYNRALTAAEIASLFTAR